MSKLTKALIAAAGNVGGAALYSEDVFSTYLYTGNGASQTIENGIALGDAFVGTSTLFDGSSDYLSRSSDLTGNSDSRTFTLSFWLRPTSLALDSYVYRSSTGFQFFVMARDSGSIEITGYDSSVTKRLDMEIPSACAVNSWTHVLVSLDLSDIGSRYAYVNDSVVTPNYFRYQDASIDFTNSAHAIAADSTGGAKYTGYLAHFYLDYTYRDLSVEANRRYFIDGNGCATSEATQSALSPILYLPLTDSTTANSGTGGNFTANGSPSIEDKGVGYEAGYGSGGLVWLKARGDTYNNLLYDTTRPVNYAMFSNDTFASNLRPDSLKAFNSDGFGLGARAEVNYSGTKFTSWTFRKAEKFFDVVTYTGNGTTQEISHNLGVAPAFIIVKETSTTRDWVCYHSALGETYRIFLNATNAATNSSSAIVWGNNTTAVAPTDSVFTVGNAGVVNNSGGTYVAYLFASDAGGFGDDGSESIIKCGSYVGTGASGNTVDFGFEPQWVLIKNTQVGTKSWHISDMMRGLNYSTDRTLSPNTSSAEANWAVVKPTATGLLFTDGDDNFNSAHTFIYIAIRRPMKTPESGTEVFGITTYSGNSSTQTVTTTKTDSPSFVGDLFFGKSRSFATDFVWTPRLTGYQGLDSNSTSAEQSEDVLTVGRNDVDLGYVTANLNYSGQTYVGYLLSRATGFFDVVAYTGNGVFGRAVEHNLGVAPEIIIAKSRSLSASDWRVNLYNVLGSTTGAILQSNSAAFNDTSAWASYYPDSSIFKVGSLGDLNASGNTYIAYLFATVAGVSKVGSYTGTGSSQTIDCGFSAGARFVLIKRTDANGDWNVFDTERGIVTGTDNILPLNNTAGESAYTDVINPNAAGFEVTSNTGDFNLSGASYIFLAIA